MHGHIKVRRDAVLPRKVQSDRLDPQVWSQERAHYDALPIASNTQLLRSGKASGGAWPCACDRQVLWRHRRGSSRSDDGSELCEDVHAERAGDSYELEPCMHVRSETVRVEPKRIVS